MSTLDHIKAKIYTAEDTERLLTTLDSYSGKVVFTNGCFDILHLGHIDYLSRAADLGSFLVIGLNTDASVSRIKGSQRPLSDENSRSLVLASLGFVGAVALFDQDTPLELIKLIQPDILVKGSDYDPADIVGYNVVVGKGGKVVTIEFVKGYSTSAIVQKILNSR